MFKSGCPGSKSTVSIHKITPLLSERFCIAGGPRRWFLWNIWANCFSTTSLHIPAVSSLHSTSSFQIQTKMCTHLLHINTNVHASFIQKQKCTCIFHTQTQKQTHLSYTNTNTYEKPQCYTFKTSFLVMERLDNLIDKSNFFYNFRS